MLPGWHLRCVQPRHVPKTTLQRDLQVQRRGNGLLPVACELQPCLCAPARHFAFVSETRSAHKPGPGLAVCLSPRLLFHPPGLQSASLVLQQVSQTAAGGSDFVSQVCRHPALKNSCQRANNQRLPKLLPRPFRAKGKILIAARGRPAFPFYFGLNVSMELNIYRPLRKQGQRPD